MSEVCALDPASAPKGGGMKPQTQHTQTPWSYGQVFGLNPDPNYWEIRGGRLNEGGFCISGIISEANAAFIVRAVNAHEELTGALSDALFLLRKSGMKGIQDTMGRLSEVLDKAEAA